MEVRIMDMMSKWENRRNLNSFKNNFNRTHGYQKLGEKQVLKEIRESGWLKTSRFIRTLYNVCWNARYELKKGGADD